MGYYVRTRSGTLILTPVVVAELVNKQLLDPTSTENEYEVTELKEDAFWRALRA